MRDYNYANADGSFTPVADLPTWKIQEVLAGEIEILPGGHGDETIAGITERLRIELTARQIERRL